MIIVWYGGNTKLSANICKFIAKKSMIGIRNLSNYGSGVGECPNWTSPGPNSWKNNIQKQNVIIMFPIQNETIIPTPTGLDPIQSSASVKGRRRPILCCSTWGSCDIIRFCPRACRRRAAQLASSRRASSSQSTTIPWTKFAQRQTEINSGFAWIPH